MSRRIYPESRGRFALRRRTEQIVEGTAVVEVAHETVVEERTMYAPLVRKGRGEVLDSVSGLELQPMTPHDRRIVHMVIAETLGLSSRGEGEGEDRHILVVPAAAE